MAHHFFLARLLPGPPPLGHDQGFGLVEEEPFIPHELQNPRLWLSDPTRGEVYPLYVTLGVLFGLLLVGGLLARYLAPRLLHGHRLRVDLLRRLADALATIAAVGLFWIGCRLVGLPLFARPLWLWFTLLALVAVIAYALYYWRTRYPRDLSAYEEMARRRRWMPSGRKRAAARRR